MLRVVVSLRAKDTTQGILLDARFVDLKDNDQKIIEALVQGKSDILVAFEAREEKTNNLIKEQFESYHKKLNQTLGDTQALDLRHFDKIIATTDRTTLMDPDEGSSHLVSNSSYRITAQTAQRARDAVLEHLWFRQIPARQDAIPKAHAETFEWVFHPDMVEDTWDDLSKWLATGSGCYWINGKAASGKSTLMKYIVRHPSTKSTLRAWSQGKDIITPSFFFWNPGTALQKSLTGLMRAIMHDILSGYRFIIPKVFPELYGEEARQLQRHAQKYQVQPLSDVELEIGFRRLLECFPSHLCLFIDGIDEYNGNHAEMSSILLSFVSRPNIKMVVSSRPIPACLRLFKDGPNLRLEDLTRKDIGNYVNSKIRAHQRMQELLIEAPEEAAHFVDQIVATASGVFLWVRLVVSLLIDGLDNCDRISDLSAKLKLLPPELGDLYKHMVSTMQPLYRQQASQFLQMALQCKDVEEDTLSILRLSFADQEDPHVAIRLSDEGITPGQLWGRCRTTHIRLLSRCCGLLEVTGNLAPTAKVVFLHKTVAEFLNEPDVQNYMLSLTAETKFDASVSLLSSALAMMKLSRCGWKAEEEQRPLITYLLDSASQFLKYCRLAEVSTQKGQIEFVEECERILALTRTEAHERQDPVVLDTHFYLSSASTSVRSLLLLPDDHFVSLLVSERLPLSLDQCLTMKPSGFFQTSGRRFLVHAIKYLPVERNLDISHGIKVIEILLSHGADPNQHDPTEESAWIIAVYYFEKAFLDDLSTFPEPQLAACKLIELFLQHGADLRGYFAVNKIRASISRHQLTRRDGAERLLQATEGIKAALKAKQAEICAPRSQPMQSLATNAEASVTSRKKSIWDYLRWG